MQSIIRRAQINIQDDTRPDKLDAWAAIFLAAMLIGSMTIVFNVAAQKGKDNAARSTVVGTPGSAGIYFTASQGNFGAFTVNRMDQTSHALLWSHEVDGLDSLVIVGDALYISVYDQIAGHGYVYALNARDGSVRWRADIGPRYFLTTPAVGDGAVYVMQWTGKIYALDIRNGKIDWIYDTGHAPYMGGGLLRPGSVAVANGMVYDTILNTLFAVDGKRGTLSWSKQITGNYLYSSPQIANGTVYLSARSQNNFGVGPQSGFISAYNAKNGKQNWTHSVSDPGPSDPALANGQVLFSATGVYALKASNGQELWHYPGQQGLFDSPYVANGVVYQREDGINNAGASIKPALLALKLTTGAKLWRRTVDVYIGAVQNGIIYAGLVPRQLATFSTSNGTLLWHQEVEKPQQQSDTPDNAPRVWVIR
jgi:outer membrane protein assembly factor BamB